MAHLGIVYNEPSWQLFLVYLFIVDAILANNTIDWSLISNILLYNLAIFFEMSMLSNLCSGVSNQANRTGWMVHRVILDAVDIRLIQSVLD